jgi:hypothetical protein
MNILRVEQNVAKKQDQTFLRFETCFDLNFCPSQYLVLSHMPQKGLKEILGRIFSQCDKELVPSWERVNWEKH